MDDAAAAARPALQSLLQSDAGQLYEELAMRLELVKTNPAAGDSFEPDVRYNVQTMGTLEDLQKWGQRFFESISTQAYQVVCDANPQSEYAEAHTKLLMAFEVGQDAAAAILVTMLMSALGLAPAIAAVIAAIIVKLFYTQSYKTTCAVWKKRIPAPPASA